ncbi:condensation domain-containing protein, partial [Cecembia rubra]|uniref:condensation domain-containing protein n=1 Tax=Cecembia rubra TaxID=1485585 RepID=UPI001FEB944D
MYLHSLQQGEGTVLYNMPSVYEVEGRLDHGLLESAFQRVVGHFAAFRTSFTMEGGDLRQDVSAWVDVRVPVRRLTESALADHLADWGKTPFNLEEAPLVRMELWETEGRQFLAIDTHHIIMDGLSYGPFFGSLSKAYSGEALAERAVDFIDYAYWQQSEAQQLERRKHGEFWQGMYSDGLPALELPTDYQAPSIRTFEGEVYSFTLDGDLFPELQGFCKESGTTPYIFLYTAFTLLLSKYAQCEDVVIGTTSAGRNLPETEDMVGMFVNTLAVRNRIDPSLSFGDFLELTRELLLSSFEHDSYPYDELVSHLRGHGHPDNGVRVMFTMLKEGEGELSLGGQVLRMLETGDPSGVKFDLTFSGTESGEGIGFSIVYAAELFSEESIQLLAVRFRNIIREAMNAPKDMLASLPVILEEEEARIREWNGTDMAIPGEALIHGLFEQKVGEYPENTALIFEQEELSYVELNGRANRLAHYLRDCGIGAERKVGICLERSAELIISILAVWKSGGAYVPLDPGYPVDRLSYMVEDSGMDLILTQESLLPLMGTICGNTGAIPVTWEYLGKVLGGYRESDPAPRCHPE